MLGVFDSGFGGLTVLHAIHQRLPSLSTVYLGDNARTPYGVRSQEEIFQFTLEGVEKLFAEGCPLVILACNTASAQALRRIQQEVLPVRYPNNRVLGVIRPTSELIPSLSKSGHIGLFATPATVASGAYETELAHASDGAVRVTSIACPGLTDLIEKGRATSSEADLLVGERCKELRDHDEQIDVVLLGCTHYPLVQSLFEKHLPPDVRVLSQGAITADRLEDYLKRHSEMDARIVKEGTRTYLTTGPTEHVSEQASLFYGEPIRFEHADIGTA